LIDKSKSLSSELKLISVITPCFNEEENVKELYGQVKTVFADLSQYEYEHIFIDNASKDRTVAILKEIAQEDRRVKIIVNTRNFGHIRSPFHALMQAKGDAVIGIVADLQDPPLMIKEFIKKWEEGYKIVIGVKT
jgi:glycosyltransferase involved in cell wall biosynthesis